MKWFFAFTVMPRLERQSMAEHSSQPLCTFFILGDAWCFYKIYSGPKSADLLLTQVLAPAVAEMEAEGLVDSWFFIRYSDHRTCA
jgi:hypothetical protein